jgi:hypothetical protein
MSYTSIWAATVVVNTLYGTDVARARSFACSLIISVHVPVCIVVIVACSELPTTPDVTEQRRWPIDAP